MTKQFNFAQFFCFLQIFLAAGRLEAQFSGGATALNEQRVAFRTWHLTNKRGSDFLLKVSGNGLQATDNTISDASTFIIEAGPDDANWTTADARWFYIRSRSTGLYLNVPESGDLPRQVNLATYSETAHGQQFRLIGTGSASQYKLRSRLSNSGPDMVLETNGDGILQADSPKADPSSEQKFAFNLAMPSGNLQYSIINAGKGRYISDNGLRVDGTPAVQIANTNESVIWLLSPVGDDYYLLQNRLTRQYLTLPEGANGGEDLVMTSVSAGERSEWKMNRSNANFEITNRFKENLYISLNFQPDGDPLKATLGIDFDQIKWIVSEMPPEPEPQTGDYTRIETAEPNPDCLFAYGILFKKGLCERIGLNPEQAALYFEFIRESIAATVGAQRVDEILQKFKLDDVGHRVELQLMVRYYFTEILPAIPFSQWSASAQAAVAEYQTKVQAVRQDFANRLQNDWDAYVDSHAANISMIDLYYYWLNADGFVWPSVYNPTAAQEELIRQYTTAAHTFGARNATIVGGTFVGASLALSIVYFNTVSLNVVQLGIKLGYFFTPVILENGLSITVSFPLQAFLLTSGPVIAVAVTAASSLALQVMEVQELERFIDKINKELNFAQQPVNIPAVFSGNNLLDRIKLLSDLDYIISAPVTSNFQYHTDDNNYIAPFEIQCPTTTLMVELGDNGTATLTPSQIGGGVSAPFCGGDIVYDISQSQFSCSDLNQTKTIHFNAQNSKKSQDCTFNATIVDRQKPTIACPSNTTVAADANCSSALGLRALASKSDNCTGSANIGVTQSPAPSTLLMGHNSSQTVTLNATDASGNTQSCQFTVTLRDITPPSISCPQNTTLTATNSAQCTVVASQIGAGFSDNCTGAVLSYALSGVNNGTGTGQVNGLVFESGVSTVAYTATDGAGLRADCAFTVKVNPCVNGKILWDQDQNRGVKDVSVAISGDQQTNALTDINGVYSLAFSGGTNFTLTPGKNLNKLNGVNASDVQRIQQHLIGNLLNNPFKWIAADVDNNNQITSLDANILQLSLLGNPGALAQFKNSWRFVPLTHGLGTPPWGFPEKINLSGITNNRTNQNFYGIKIGDVTTTAANPANAGMGNPFTLRTTDQRLEAGTTIATTFQAAPVSDLAAFQFALHFDPEQLELAGIEPLEGGLPLSLDNFGSIDAENGILRVVWAGYKNLNLIEETPVFRLIFKVLEDGNLLSEVLQIRNEVLPGKAFTSHFVESAVQLQYVATTGIQPAPDGQASVLQLQNQPNPFDSQTSLSFVLPENGMVELRIFDGTGKTLVTRSARLAAGSHRETFDFGHLPPGILYAELKTPFGTARRKMVVTR